VRGGFAGYDRNVMPPASARTILTMLTREYGPRPWQCWGKAVDVLIDTILSQSTSAANSSAGYRQLRRRFRSWNQVATAPVSDVERCIRVSGLSRIKAPRIQQILRQIKSDRGKIDLQFLGEMEDSAAYQYLTAFQGIGPKTAACTLLFAFGKMVFPVDTHIHRIAIRLGLIDRRISSEAAQEQLTSMISPADRYAMHLLLIEHGRKMCRASRPLCGKCVLATLCRRDPTLRQSGGEIK
jgi:endonuclease III